jgi:ribosomal protein S15P/S13E
MAIEIDVNDEKSLINFAKETVTLAETYANARASYGAALKTLKLELAKAYKEGTVKESISEDKAFIMLSNNSEALKVALENVVEDEQSYKGLEKVVEARQAVVTLYQSLLKNRPK